MSTHGVITEEEEYQRIVDNPPPTKSGQFTEDRKRVFLGSNGEKYSVIERRTYFGTPELVTLEDDLHDSFWRYPLLDKRIVDAPDGVQEAKNHAEYWAAKRK